MVMGSDLRFLCDEIEAGEHTGFLFAVPSFFEGMARVVDFGNSLSMYNYSPDAAIADARAMRADWLALGCDVRAALAQLREEAEAGRPVR